VWLASRSFRFNSGAPVLIKQDHAACPDAVAKSKISRSCRESNPCQLVAFCFPGRGWQARRWHWTEGLEAATIIFTRLCVYHSGIMLDLPAGYILKQPRGQKRVSCFRPVVPVTQPCFDVHPQAPVRNAASVPPINCMN
jgi:hypothetical protein